MIKWSNCLVVENTHNVPDILTLDTRFSVCMFVYMSVTLVVPPCGARRVRSSLRRQESSSALDHSPCFPADTLPPSAFPHTHNCISDLSNIFRRMVYNICYASLYTTASLKDRFFFSELLLLVDQLLEFLVDWEMVE